MPYSLFEGGVSGGFLIVELPDAQTALPYFALREMKHHSKPERIVLEFASGNVEVHGSGLGQLFEALALLKVKRMNSGVDKQGCKIESIKLLEG